MSCVDSDKQDLPLFIALSHEMVSRQGFQAAHDPSERADLVPDDLRERVAPLLPPAPERRRRYPGRLRVPDRVALAEIMYVLRTGVAWRDVPAETVGCSGVTPWRRLRDWTEAETSTPSMPRKGNMKSPDG